MASGTDQLPLVPETSSNLELLKHAITINQIIGRFTTSGISLDHGILVGLSDDDHPQYYNSARLTTALADYVTDTELTTALASYVTSASLTTTLGSYYTIAAADAAFAPISHTHTAAQITDFNESVDDRVAALVVAGNNIAVTYNDAGGSLTIDATTGGASVSGSWTFDTGTTAADPGNKKIRFNNATLASVTALYINDTTNQNFDAGTILSFLASGSRIYLQQKNNASKAALFQVSGAATDNTGWWTVPVTVVASGTLPDNAADCATAFIMSSAGGGSSTLDGLTDVDTTGAADGDVLTYDSASSSWVAAAPTGGSGGTGSGTFVTHVDAPPETPEAEDDEFEGSSLDVKWVDANIGSVTKTVAKGSLTLSLPTEATGNLRGVEQVLPAGNWRFEAKTGYDNSSANTVAAGIGLRENSTGKVLAHYRSWSGGAAGWAVNYWTSYTTFSSGIYGANLGSYGWPLIGWQYQAIEYDGTNYMFEVSRDGVVWLRLATVAKASYFTADRIMLLCYNGNSGTTVKLAVDWFRKIGSTYAPGQYLVNANPMTPPVSPDSYPSTANAMDDEFEGSSLASKWTWRNQGSTTATLSSGSLLLTPPAVLAYNLRGIEQTISGSGKWRAKVATNAHANYHQAGMYVCANGTGKIMSVSSRYQSTNKTSVLKANNSTSVSSLPYDTDLTRVLGGNSGWHYFEIEYDGTNLHFRVSANGVSFITLFSEAAATFLGTPDRIGLFVDCETTGTVNVAAFDWFRRIS